MSNRIALALLLAVTFAVKAGVLAQLAEHPLLQPQGELDSTYYVDLAHKVAAGGPLAVTEPFFVSPLYVFFLAGVFKAGEGLLAVKVVQILLGTAAVWLVYLTARCWFDDATGFVAAALAAATGLFTFYEVLILQAALDPFLVAVALYLLTRALREASGSLVVTAGLALGLLVLNRPNALAYVGVATGLLAGLVRGRHAVLLAAGVLLVLFPSALRNYAASGEFVWIASHGGLNFYIGNHPGADGTYSPVAGIRASIAGQARDAKRVAEAAEGRRLSSGEVSRYFYRRAWSWMTSEPLGAARLFAWKLLVLLNRVNVPLNYSYAYYAEDEPTWLRFLPVGPWLLMPLGLAGLCLARPNQVGSWQQSRAYWIWASFVPVYGVSVAAFFVSSRYRMPLLLPLSIMSGRALVGVARWAPSARLDGLPVWTRRVAAIGTFALLATICNWNLGLDNGVGGEQTRQAVWLVEHGRPGEARRYVETIAPRHPTPGVLRFRVARALAKRGRPHEAIDQYRQALAIDRQPAIELELGQALVARGQSREAVSHLQAAFEAGCDPPVSGPALVRALAVSGRRAEAAARLASLPDSIASGRADTAFDLGVMGLELGAPAESERWLRLAVAGRPDHAAAHEHLGLALLFQGRGAEAIAPLETATRLDPSSASAFLNLAVVYAETGRRADARRAVETSLRLDPAEARAVELLSILRAR